MKLCGYDRSGLTDHDPKNGDERVSERIPHHLRFGSPGGYAGLLIQSCVRGAPDQSHIEHRTNAQGTALVPSRKCGDCRIGHWGPMGLQYRDSLSARALHAATRQARQGEAELGLTIYGLAISGIRDRQFRLQDVLKGVQSHTMRFRHISVLLVVGLVLVCSPDVARAGFLDGISNAISSAADTVSNGVTSAVSTVTNVTEGATNTVTNGVNTAVDSVSSALNTATGAVQQGFDTATG